VQGENLVDGACYKIKLRIKRLPREALLTNRPRQSKWRTPDQRL